MLFVEGIAKYIYIFRTYWIFGHIYVYWIFKKKYVYIFIIFNLKRSLKHTRKQKKIFVHPVNVNRICV